MVANYTRIEAVLILAVTVSTVGHTLMSGLHARNNRIRKTKAGYLDGQEVTGDKLKSPLCNNCGKTKSYDTNGSVVGVN